MGSVTTALPPRISRCWQNFGYHALGAGPCFDTVEQAVAYRDRELDRIGRECDAKADRWCYFDFDANRDVTWREQWDKQGWPDSRDEPWRLALRERQAE